MKLAHYLLQIFKKISHNLYNYLLSIEYISSKCDEKEASKLSDCKDQLSEDEKKKYSNCCFAENKAGNKACIALTKDDYDKIICLVENTSKALIAYCRGLIKNNYSNSY